jgi:hypothetical protein
MRQNTRITLALTLFCFLVLGLFAVVVYALYTNSSSSTQVSEILLSFAFCADLDARRDQSSDIPSRVAIAIWTAAIAIATMQSKREMRDFHFFADSAQHRVQGRL